MLGLPRSSLLFVAQKRIQNTISYNSVVLHHSHSSPHISVSSTINRLFASNATAGRPADFSHVFDRDVKRAQRDRSVYLSRSNPQEFDYLRDEIARRVVDRLDDIKDRSFPLALDLGSGAGHILKALEDRGGIEELHMLDSSALLLNRDAGQDADFDLNGNLKINRICADEESFSLSVPSKDYDVVFSVGALHWINDIPGVFAQAKSVLKPDGLFLGALLGGKTLQELRISFQLAEMEQENGIAPHVSPFADVADVGALLQRAGFHLPAVDFDDVHIHFPDVKSLVRHLRGMGESNALRLRRNFIPQRTLDAVERIYRERFSSTDVAPGDGSSGSGVSASSPSNSIVATFEVIYFIGWAPHSSQPQPKRRGTAQVSMSTVAHHSGSMERFDATGMEEVQDRVTPKPDVLKSDVVAASEDAVGCCKGTAPAATASGGESNDEDAKLDRSEAHQAKYRSMFPEDLKWKKLEEVD